MGILGRWRLSAGMGLVLLLTVAGCGLLEPGIERGEGGAILTAGDLKAFDLRLGDCFNAADAREVESVAVMPCSDDHDFEIYHVFQLDDGAYPGQEAIEDEWVDRCLARFEPFVGLSYDTSVLDISALFPTEESWKQDDREVLCALTAVDELPRAGSARGSGV